MPSSLPEPYLTLELDGEEVRRFSLDRPETSIGRARNSNVQIAVRGVSRAHALVLRDESGICIVKDLGSANGTFVNGYRIPGERVLEVGDVINFLDYALRFHRAGGDPADFEVDVTGELDETDENSIQPFTEDGMPTEHSVKAREASRPKTTARTGPPTTITEALRYVIEVRDPSQGTQMHVVDQPVTTIGGGANSAIRLSVRRLDRLHSILVLVEGRLLYVRLSPIHIARINGTARMVSFLDIGDEIAIGQSSLLVKKA
jgi:predicted component of type VI protein secretion system